MVSFDGPQERNNNNLDVELANLESSFLARLDTIRRRHQEEQQSQVAVPPDQANQPYFVPGRDAEESGNGEFIDQDHVEDEAIELNLESIITMEQESLSPSNVSNREFPSHGRRVGLLGGLRGTIVKLRECNDASAISDTGGIHMKSLVALTLYSATPWQSMRQWCVALTSISIVLTQIMVLAWLILEALYPTCATQNDCRIGEFCQDAISFPLFTQPRCIDCDHVPNGDWVNNCTEYEDLHESLLVWVTHDNVWNPTSLQNDTNAVSCLQYLHCKETSIEFEDTYFIDQSIKARDYGHGDYMPHRHQEYSNHCDHLILNKEKSSWAHSAVFIFAASLFSALLYSEINQCVIEEEVLKYALRKRDPKQRAITPIELIRISIRMRKFLLPWWVTCAATSILISDDLSVKNILLNLLAVAFVLEADDLFGVLFVTEREKELVEKLVDSAKENGNISIPFWGSRMLAVLPCVMMVLVDLHIVEIVAWFGHYVHGGNCSDISHVIGLLFSIRLPGFTILANGIKQLVTFDKRSDSSAVERISGVMLELSRNMHAWVLSIIFAVVVYFSAYNNGPQYDILLLTVSIHIVNTFFFILLSHGIFSNKAWNVLLIVLNGCFLVGCFTFTIVYQPDLSDFL
jgi:hypothetical protein